MKADSDWFKQKWSSLIEYWVTHSIGRRLDGASLGRNTGTKGGWTARTTAELMPARPLLPSLLSRRGASVCTMVVLAPPRRPCFCCPPCPWKLHVASTVAVVRKNSILFLPFCAANLCIQNSWWVCLFGKAQAARICTKASICYLQFLIVEDRLCLALKLMKLEILQAQARASHAWKPGKWQRSTVHCIAYNVLFVWCINPLVLNVIAHRTLGSSVIIFKPLEPATTCPLANSKR